MFEIQVAATTSLGMEISDALKIQWSNQRKSLIREIKAQTELRDQQYKIIDMLSTISNIPQNPESQGSYISNTFSLPTSSLHSSSSSSSSSLEMLQSAEAENPPMVAQDLMLTSTSPNSPDEATLVKIATNEIRI